MAVARFEPIPSIPIFARIDVRAANTADPSANQNHIFIHLFYINSFRMTTIPISGIILRTDQHPKAGGTSTIPPSGNLLRPFGPLASDRDRCNSPIRQSSPSFFALWSGKGPLQFPSQKVFSVPSALQSPKRTTTTPITRIILRIVHSQKLKKNDHNSCHKNYSLYQPAEKQVTARAFPFPMFPCHTGC